MAELMAMHGWSYPPLRSPSPASASRRSDSPNKTVLRARSSNALADMASSSRSNSAPFRPSPSLLEDTSLNTLKDPRTASTSDLSTISPHHPDLSNEVAALSDKLIQAINNQSRLDDNLSETRHELEDARARIHQLEGDVRKHEEDLSSGRLVWKADVEADLSRMRETLEAEKTKRAQAEKEKKGMEQELENLTAALFEEANKMVSAAKKDREAVERKNELLRAQIKDTEMLLASHQEQLAELKSVMQQMNSDRDELDARTNPSTAPTSPCTTTNQPDNINRLLEAVRMSPATSGSGDISPAPSTSYSHLIKSVCRTDIQAFDEFHQLFQQARASKPHSRAGSGSYAGLNVMNLTTFSTQNLQPAGQQPHTNGAKISSPNGVPSSPRDPSSAAALLKESRFYKRILAEDIEPTLRLDTAPGISWLTRRSVLSSICEGGLMIEPMPPASRKFISPCSLCGERRQGRENPRNHRFRTSDNESAQRHPLCTLCLEKLRATCDFVGYLRLIVDGHLRNADDDDEREAWEETIRLRERLFWARLGGGVVPAFMQRKDDASTSANESPRLPDRPLITTNGVLARDLDKIEDPFSSKADRASIGNTVISINGIVTSSTESSNEQPNGASKGDDAVSPTNGVDQPDKSLTPRPTTPVNCGLNTLSPVVTPKRPRSVESALQVTIPTSGATAA